MSDDVPTEIAPTSSWHNQKRYCGVGRCIYCDNRGARFTREHIIPQGLGGHSWIAEASCSVCKRAFDPVETKCIDGFFTPARVFLSLRARAKHKLPKTVRVIARRDGDTGPFKKISIPREYYHGLFMMPVFQSLPNWIFGTTHEISKSANFAIYSFVKNVSNNTDLEMGIGNASDLTTYCRCLAKIAHCYLIAELGVGSFSPVLTNVIVGDEDPFVYVGGDPHIPPPWAEMHAIWHEIVQPPKYPSRDTPFVLVNIRLFANLGGPIYRVVAGSQ